MERKMVRKRERGNLDRVWGFENLELETLESDGKERISWMRK